METQRDSTSLQRWSLLLLLLGLVVTPATSRTLSYREAVLRVVDSLNQRSSDENLYRLLKLNSEPQGDENPNIPQPASFTVKETVCPKTTQQPLEQCDFKDNGLVKQCAGTVSLDEDKSYFDISCEENVFPFDAQNLEVSKFGGLRDLLGRARRGIRRIGRRIRRLFTKYQLPEEES
ncbi:cathelicidin antimicrobial peptide isoform X1 [Mustela erminea]|uniref:cathelicidin antimicrobial peptide isoform X1 n=1 Tax=Mustela erminea TaxID=36723 RepID=UPI00138766FF|nr:cathelicidin antimicrobial peptide isoform X1 [Mustela erminea]